MNLKERISERVNKIPLKWSNDELTVALKSIYDDFEKEGISTKVIALHINETILEGMRENQRKLNTSLDEFKGRLSK